MTPWLNFESTTCIPKELHVREHHEPYSLLERFGGEVPSIIQMVGNVCKGRMIEGYTGQDTELAAVHVRKLKINSKHVVLIDTPWPPRRVSSFNNNPPANSSSHRFHGEPVQSPPFQSTVKIFSKLLSSVTHTVALFMDDFSGHWNAIELLADWIRFSPPVPNLRPRLLLIGQFDQEKETKAVFLDQLLRYITKTQQARCPTKVYTRKDAAELFWACFESIHLSCSNHRSLDWILQHSEEIRVRRQSLGWAYSAHHLKCIMKSAIKHFMLQETESFNAILALRSQDPAEKDFCSHIGRLIKLTNKTQYTELRNIIASALIADAYPQTGHWFLADLTFKSIYKTSIESLSKTWKLKSLVNDVETAFYNFARQIKCSEKSAFASHIDLLKRSAELFKGKFDKTSCFTCLAQNPSGILGCGHSICARCIRSLPNTEVEPCRFLLPRCPLCQVVNTEEIYLRPPTASTRILVLDGPVQSKNLVGHFLRDLYAKLALHLPFQDYFDIVHAGGIGAYYTLSIYLSGRSIYSCIQGAKSASALRLQRSLFQRSGSLDFGDSQSWCLSDINSHRGAAIYIHHKNKTYTNAVVPAERCNLSTDILVQYQGDVYSNAVLTKTADQLIGSLFYIELAALPRWRSSRHHCRLLLQCCVPSGVPLVSLQKRLEGTSVCCWGEGGRRQRFDLRDAWTHQSTFQTISFDVELCSLESLIEVDFVRGQSSFPVSKCPYRLRDLIRDQGLENPWYHTSKGSTGSVSRLSEVGKNSLRNLSNELVILQRTMKEIYKANHEE